MQRNASCLFNAIQNYLAITQCDEEFAENLTGLVRRKFGWSIDLQKFDHIRSRT